MSVVLHHGDCLEVMRGMAEASVDAVVTDPPYHLTSIVKRFGSENAAPVEDGVYARSSAGFMGKQWDGGDIAFRPEMWAETLRLLKPGGHLVAFSGTRTYHRMACAIEDAGFEIRDQLAWVYGSGFPKSHDAGGGWGTALKPAWEPICLARKPLVGTVAQNVTAHGTGALNIDGCRIAGDVPRTGRGTSDSIYGGGKGLRPAEMGTQQFEPHPAGRWPANLLHDGSDEVLEAFAAFGERPGQLARARSDGGEQGNSVYGALRRVTNSPEPRGDTGTAARFFFSAKASRAERGEGNTHPTVKPLALMQWLCRLVTPVGGTALDPFAGSGSTLIAAAREGFSAIGIEREAEYIAIAHDRLRGDAPLFAEVA